MMASGRRPLLRIGLLTVLTVSAVAACGDDDVPGAGVPAAESESESDVESSGFGETNWRADDLPGMGAVLGTQRATYEYYIPEGASDRLAAGEPLDIVPGRFEAVVGESVKIVNDDRRGHNVGPWYVGPNETLIQKFTSPGVYEGLCTVHPSGALILEVREA